MQCSVYGDLFTKLSQKAEDYDKIVRNLKNPDLRQELRNVSNLKPFFDSNGSFHMPGRLGKTNLPFDVKHQIIMPKRHAFTHMLVQEHHEKTGLSGPLSMLEST